MASDYDATEFIDGDFEIHKSPYSAAPGAPAQAQRAPTREELEAEIAQKLQTKADLERQREELERQKSALEEIRRRQMEFENGRQEMQQNLTRGLGLLEEAEFSARRDAEQMSKVLTEFRDALGKIQAIREESWTADNLNVELTRALTTLENARMEWNTARLKFSVLSGQPANVETAKSPATPTSATSALLSTQSFGQLCRIGLALTWPLAAVALIALTLLAVMLLRR
jgi:hypothetical protein